MADTRNIRINVDIDGDNSGATKTTKALGDAAKASDNLGDSFKETAKDAKSLNVQIGESEKRVAALRKQLVETGNDKNIRKALRGEESWLRELTKIQSAGLPDAPTGRLASRVTGPLVGVGALGIVAAAPAIGATIAGAVAGAIGTVGIAGGIAMAAKDPRVKSAAEAFGAEIQKEFFRGGEVFVGPIQQSLKILSGAFKEMELPETFAKMAPHVTTIAGGFAGLGKNIMPGLNKAFDRMGPLADRAAAGLADTGSALGQFMDDVTGSKGTLEGLNTFFFLLNSTIRGVGGGLKWLGDRYDETLTFTDQLAKGFEDLPGMVGGGWAARQTRENIAAIRAIGNELPEFSSKVIEATDVVTTSNAETAESWKLIEERIRGALKAQNEYFDRQMALPNAMEAFEEAIDNFNESLKENGRTFDIGTEKGRANRDAMQALITTAKDVRSAQIELNGDVTAANRTYEENIKKIEGIANAAGVTADELRDMAGDYYVNIYRKELTHKVTYFSNHDLVDTRKGDFRAAGGPVQPGVPYVINERGMETVTFPANGTVHPAHLTPMSGSGMAIAWGTGPTDDLGAAIWQWLRKNVRIQGAGDVQMALGT
jgi:hypothetical protein